MKKIGFIGAGNMAGALIRGFLDVAALQARRHLGGGSRRLAGAAAQARAPGGRYARQPAAGQAVPDRHPGREAADDGRGAGGDPVRDHPEEALRLDRGGIPPPAPGDRARRPGPRRPGHAEHPGPGGAWRVGGGRGQQGHPDRSEADAQALQGRRRGGVDHRRGPARRRHGTLGQRAGLRLPLRGEPDRGRRARRPAAEPGHPARLRDPRRRRRRCWARAGSRHASCATW